MIFQGVENWENPEKYSGLLFFAQRMDELTFIYTIDSYKAPTTNVAILSQEFLDCLNDRRKAGLPDKAAFHIFDEFKNRLTGNIVAKSLIGLNLESYVSAGNKDVAETEKRLSIFAQEANPYIYSMQIMKLIKELSTTNRKEDLDYLARELVTTLLWMKQTNYHINRTVKNVFFSNRKVKDENILDQFYRDLFPHAHDFTICLKIKSDISFLNKDLLKKINFEILDNTNGVFTVDNVSNKFKKLAPEEKFIVVREVRASEPNQAVQIAIKRILNITNLYRIFNHKEKFEISSEGMAEQKCCAGKIYSIPTNSNRMHFIADNRVEQARKKLSDLIYSRILVKNDDAQKLIQAVGFHGISLSTDIEENQILNLWIAFETIVPQDINKNNADSIAKKVAPFIGLQYFRKLFRCITFDIILWTRSEHHGGKKSEFHDALKSIDFPQEYDLIDKIFQLITNKEHEQKLRNLLSSMENFELLKFRINQLNKAFSSPEKAHATLMEHQQRVVWQIYRIYRTRNAIVHSGDIPAFAGSLVENAHDYFDQMFSLLCDLSVSEGGFTNFEECFNFVGMHFQEYVNELKSLEKFDELNTLRVLWRPKIVPKTEDFFEQEEE